MDKLLELNNRVFNVLSELYLFGTSAKIGALSLFLVIIINQILKKNSY